MPQDNCVAELPSPASFPSHSAEGFPREPGLIAPGSRISPLSVVSPRTVFFPSTPEALPGRDSTPRLSAERSLVIEPGWQVAGSIEPEHGVLVGILEAAAAAHTRNKELFATWSASRSPATQALPEGSREMPSR